MSYQVNILDITHVMQQHIPLKNKYYSINFILKKFSISKDYSEYLVFSNKDYILEFKSSINSQWLEFTLKEVTTRKPIHTFILTPHYEDKDTLVSTSYSTDNSEIIEFFKKLKDKFNMAMELLK